VGGAASGFTMQEFIWEFSDLLDQDLDEEFLRQKFRQAVNMRKFQQAARGVHQLDTVVVDVAALSDTFRKSPHLMRALVKSRLFNGTLSAGGGSCQITVKPDQNDEQRRRRSPTSSRSSDHVSIQLGNKTPMNGDSPLFARDVPMSETLLELWRGQIREEIRSMDLPPKMNKGLRGVYIGISAVYYAAKTAKCHERLLPKVEFLAHLDNCLKNMLESQTPPVDCDGHQEHQLYDHREFANLVLVHEIVSSVLAESAWVVCKREWKAQPAGLEVAGSHGDAECVHRGPDLPSKIGAASDMLPSPLKLPEYVATWSLGFYLSRLEGL